MKVVTYTIEVSFVLDFEDPGMDELENLQPELNDEQDIFEHIRDSVHDGNYLILRDKNGQILKKYETVTM